MSWNKIFWNAVNHAKETRWYVIPSMIESDDGSAGITRGEGGKQARGSQSGGGVNLMHRLVQAEQT